MSKQQATLSKLCSTLSKQHSTFFVTNGNNVERFYCKMSSFRQSRMLLRHFCRFWQQCCRFGKNVACFGNNVEATFDIVERIVQVVAFDNVAGTLLLVRTGLKCGLRNFAMLNFVAFTDQRTNRLKDRQAGNTDKNTTVNRTLKCSCKSTFCFAKS